MSEYILLIVAIIAVSIGFFIGKYMTSLKNKSNQSTLHERANQLQAQYEEAKKTADQQLTFIKQEQETYKQSVVKQLENMANEREEIRREKDFLNTELTRRNTEFENLQLKKPRTKK